jgi:multidrug resistance protein, MATE family
VIMVVDSGAALLNIVLDYAWIFGRWGFPEMGIAGAAWATATSQWARALAYWLLAESPRYREKYQWAAGRRLDLPLMRRLWRYGGPNGLQFLVETAAFTVFVLLVGWLGEKAVAATTLAFNVNSLAFVPILGLGTAVTTMVGQQLGRNRPDLAARATWTSLWMALLYTGVLALAYVLVPNLFLAAYASGADPQEFQGLRDVIVVLLWFVAGYSLFDATNIVFSGAIKGAGDTRFILMTTLVMSPTPVLIAWLGVVLFGWGLLWCWAVLMAWICTLGLIYMARFLQGRWRHMRVIEPEVFADENPLSVEPAMMVHWGPATVVEEPGQPLE